MDIAFLVDSSGSLGKRNYQILLDTVKSMATYLDVSPLGTHASVILFSDGVENPITFNDFLTLDRFKKKVSRLTYMSQRTRIDLALDMAAKKVFTKEGNVRDYVPKIAILMTDGRQTRTRDQLSLTEVAGNLRKKGVTLYVIGVGRGVARSELESLVEKRSYVIQQPDFRKLLQNIDNISQRVCEDHQGKYVSSKSFLLYTQKLALRP